MKVGKPPDVSNDPVAREQWLYIQGLVFGIVRARHGSPVEWPSDDEEALQALVDESQMDFYRLARVMFREETDRGCALFGGTMLERDVILLLVEKMRMATVDKVETIVPTARQQRGLALALGLLSEDEAHDLERIATTRNKFGHDLTLSSFERLGSVHESKLSRNELLAREALRQFRLDPLNDRSNLRFRFCRVVAILAARLGERRRLAAAGTYASPEACQWVRDEAALSVDAWAKASWVSKKLMRPEPAGGDDGT